jgi:hypothetical protein
LFDRPKPTVGCMPVEEEEEDEEYYFLQRIMSEI